jgi:hypothetical protein
MGHPSGPFETAGRDAIAPGQARREMAQICWQMDASNLWRQPV